MVTKYQKIIENLPKLVQTEINLKEYEDYNVSTKTT